MEIKLFLRNIRLTMNVPLQVKSLYKIRSMQMG